MPSIALSQPSRSGSYAAALSYYGAALWPLIPVAKNFFGPQVSAVAALLLWAFAMAALASVWPLVWTTNRRETVWRAPLALFLTVLPPLGIIGFASPLTAAGFLFPNTSWCGLLAFSVFSGGLAAWPRNALPALAALALVFNADSTDPKPPATWQGINTKFGAIAHERVNPITEYQVAQWIQQFALSSNAKVIVFPETVVPTWSVATEAFWQQTLDRLRASGKTILFGARVPLANSTTTRVVYDFTADLAALRGATHGVCLSPIRSVAFPQRTLSYLNSVLVRGAHTSDFHQRIPVPIAMWNPLRTESARPNVFGPGVIEVAGERAAILVCYEQLLTWPVLQAGFRHSTLLVGVANDHWATNTPIPAFQLAAVRAWSRLFGIPAVTAMNQ
jgi:hypothetical protein